jgi:hypothetical protein
MQRSRRPIATLGERRVRDAPTIANIAPISSLFSQCTRTQKNNGARRETLAPIYETN